MCGRSQMFQRQFYIFESMHNTKLNRNSLIVYSAVHFFPLFIYYFCLNSDTVFADGYSVRCWIRCFMLNLLFRVRFFFCFSNSIIYWLSVRLCTLYIYDDMALVITITIVRERIGNSVLFLYVTVLSPYSNLHTIF